MLLSRALRHVLLLVLCAVPWLLAPVASRAMPSFAEQTGQPCSACHVGSFGPLLTPFGRAFKIGAYTQTGGTGFWSRVPLAAYLLGSFTHTNTAQPEPPAEHFGRNNNLALDQLSVFYAGRLTDRIGAFIQGTYDGVDKTFVLDNTDVRAAWPLNLPNGDLLLGLSLNNGPTVQDPYNSTYAWIFPFATSKLAPTPTAQPLLAGGLLGNSVGVTGYAWYDRHLYLEVGLYNSYAPTLLKITGATLGPGATSQPAPYLRIAYEWNWAGQSAHIGMVLLHAALNPASGERTTTSMFGTDRYTDVAVDAGYQFLGDGTHVVAIDAILTHEHQYLAGSTGLGSSTGPDNHLNQVRVNFTYFYQGTYGINFGWQNTWGNPNPALFPPQAVSGSANGKPNSNSFIIEGDWVPFGKQGSWGRPFANLKIGVQYIIYTLFNGGRKNYDGFGRNASDNNTLFVYVWVPF
jgi:hypothetical protein